VADNESQSPGLQGNVWDYVRRRNELDREIQEKFARPVTIMFTDIKGSTTFFDMRGDLEGVTMLQRHNDLVVPPIESEGGRVLQRLGDGLLAVFPSATPGVKAGIEIQKRLHAHNEGRGEREQILVRVGLNTGMGLVEESNVFGDAVNTAARVQTLAEPGQILVSEATYQEASRDLGSEIFLPVGASALKGKLEKVVVYDVVWSQEQARLRAAVPASPDSAQRTLHIGVSRVAARLTVSSRETGGSGEAAERETEEATYDEATLGQTLQRLEAILAGADRDGHISKQNLEDLSLLGRQLTELLLPPKARARWGAWSAPPSRWPPPSPASRAARSRSPWWPTRAGIFPTRSARPRIWAPGSATGRSTRSSSTIARSRARSCSPSSAPATSCTSPVRSSTTRPEARPAACVSPTAVSAPPISGACPPGPRCLDCSSSPRASRRAPRAEVPASRRCSVWPPRSSCPG